MQDKIHSLLKKKDLLLQVELNFVIHVQNKQLFSPPEEKTINNLYHKYCENGWLRSYDKRKRRIMKSCAEFWVNNPPRFSELAAKVLNDPDFVPTKDQYKECVRTKRRATFSIPKRQDRCIRLGAWSRSAAYLRSRARGARISKESLELSFVYEETSKYIQAVILTSCITSCHKEQQRQ